MSLWRLVGALLQPSFHSPEHDTLTNNSVIWEILLTVIMSKLMVDDNNAGDPGEKYSMSPVIVIVSY